jgi:hypothetical protein
MSKIPNIKRICENCGKPQPIIKEKSNHNWNAYDPKAKCECGGKFVFAEVKK